MKRLFLGATLVVVTSTLSAQWDSIAYAERDTTRLLYDSGFDFREGIYFGFEDFRANRPSVAQKDLLDEKGRPAGDPRQNESDLYYTDSAGTKQHIHLDRIWGFCAHDVVYVRIGDGFNRLGLMGSLSHIVYDNTSRGPGYYDPVFGGTTTTTTVQEQRLLDMETGTFLPVNASSIYQVIQRDPDLRTEFEALPKKERNHDETIFRFMRRYNERYPLYFPK